MNNILITGGTGFFGKSILSLVKNGYLQDYNFIILSRDPEKFLSNYIEFKDIPNVDYIKGNILDFKYDNYNIDYIIHAATTADHKIDDSETYQTILSGTKNILEFSKKCKNLKNILYISSGGVYGKLDKKANEFDNCNPFTVYGKAKLEAEKLCLSSNLPIIISRCFSFIGKYLPKTTHFAIGNFINNCIHNQPIVINGDGTSIRSYMYSDDLVFCLFKLLFSKEFGEIYNIGNDEMISIKELAKTVKESLNSNSEIIIKGEHIDLSNDFYVPDISKFNKKFNLKLNKNLKENILKSI